MQNDLELSRLAILSLCCVILRHEFMEPVALGYLMDLSSSFDHKLESKAMKDIGHPVILGVNTAEAIHKVTQSCWRRDLRVGIT